MTIIEQIKAEIERRIELHDSLASNAESEMIANLEIGAAQALDDLLSFLSTLESEKPMNPDDAMKELDEKIALVKQRGTWDGVDVDKYMDEVRGREPKKPMEGLDEEIDRLWESFADEMEGPHNLFDIYARLARHFAEWGAEH